MAAHGEYKLQIQKLGKITDEKVCKTFAASLQLRTHIHLLFSVFVHVQAHQ